MEIFSVLGPALAFDGLGSLRTKEKFTKWSVSLNGLRTAAIYSIRSIWGLCFFEKNPTSLMVQNLRRSCTLFNFVYTEGVFSRGTYTHKFWTSTSISTVKSTGLFL